MSVCLIFFMLFVVSKFNIILSRSDNPNDINLSELPQSWSYSMPQWDKGKPVVVMVSIFIQTLSNFSPSKKSFDVTIGLKCSWDDSRLAFNSSSNEQVILIDPAKIRKIWTPDFYFYNARRATTPSVLKSNTYLAIDPTGRMIFQNRAVLSLTCHYDFRNFPLDHQGCGIQLMSYSRNEHYIVAQWRAWDPIKLEPVLIYGNKVSQMKLLRFEPMYCTTRDSVFENDQYFTFMNQSDSVRLGLDRTTVNYSCLSARFVVKRRITFYIFETYLPTTIIVIVSWFSFWIDPSAAPARVTLSFTTFLTLSTAWMTASRSLPPVSYLGLWMSVCNVFVFASLLEFAIVYNLISQGKNFGEKDPDRAEKMMKKAAMVDRIFAVFCPALFCLFVVVYCCIYAVPWNNDSTVYEYLKHIDEIN